MTKEEMAFRRQRPDVRDRPKTCLAEHNRDARRPRREEDPEHEPLPTDGVDAEPASELGQQYTRACHCDLGGAQEAP